MADARQLADELNELVGAAGRPEPPKNLGNFPDEPSLAAERPEPASDEDPSAEPVRPSHEPAAEPEPIEEPAAAPTDTATLRAQLEAMQREITFLRAGQTPQAPQETAPSLPFAVTEDDINVILGGGPKAAQYIQNALLAVAASTAQATEQRLVQMYQQTQSVQQTSQSLRQQFYEAHPALTPYYEVVGAQAQAVAQRFPYADPPTLLRETAQATREELRRRGIVLPTAEAPRRQRAKLRPATAESGGSRSNGATKLNPIERDIFQMMAAGR